MISEDRGLGCLLKLKYHLRLWNKTSKKKYHASQDRCKINVYDTKVKITKMSTMLTYCRLKQGLLNVGLITGKSCSSWAPNIASTISSRAWNTHSKISKLSSHLSSKHDRGVCEIASHWSGTIGCYFTYNTVMFCEYRNLPGQRANVNSKYQGNDMCHRPDIIRYNGISLISSYCRDENQ